MAEMEHPQIKVFDRRDRKFITEKVYGDLFVRWLYDYKIGQLLTDSFFIRKPVSQLMGLYYNSSASRSKIPPFITGFGLDMSEYEIPEGNFRSFNQFFVRQFKTGKRPFSMDSREVCAPAEGRYLAFENFSVDQTFVVKGARIHVRELIKDDQLSKEFDGGTCVIARLCPVDYHRFHFHDAGTVKSMHKVPGKLHSVNPRALRYDPTIFMGNYREVTLLEARNTGPTLYVEVGALGVGAITQLVNVNDTVLRGSQKGYFEFGGSTLILIFRRNAVKIEADIIERSHQHTESLIRLGETFGKSHSL